MIEKLGPYNLLRLLGEGGMGQVFEAEDTRSGARVALKLLRGGASATLRERELFAREARVGLELKHPGLVRVTAVEIQYTEQPYLVMEYLPGPTLKAALEQGPLDPLNVVSLALPVLDTLAFVHGNGVIHRDVKTGNIMLDHAGAPRLMDFGLTSFSDETSLSRTGIVFGSPHYMSPEQGLGEKLDARSDLFSFGIVLYELCAGRLPFRGTHPLSVIYAILNEEPQPLRRHRPELPAALDWILAKALAKNRNERYQSAGTMSQDLRQLAQLLQGRIAEADLRLEALPDRTTAEEESFPLPLVGRDEEIHRLLSWLAAPGKRTVFCLSGEAGVGKTRLVREALKRRGLDGPSPCVGRAQPGREHFPYQPWLEALRPALAERDLMDREALRDLLESASPGAGARTAILWPFLSGDKAAPAENREQLFEGVHLLLGALGQRDSLLIWLEDVHQVDRASLDLLGFLARSPEGELPPVLLSWREEDLAEDAPLRDLIRDLAEAGKAERMALGRLSLASVSRLVADVIPSLPDPQRAADRLHAESKGNPFFLRELLENIRRRLAGRGRLASDPEDWTLPLPALLLDLLGHRLKVLDSEERELLELAAVEGEAFSAEVLAAVLEQRKIHVLRRLQRLERRTRLVQAREGRFLFDHALLRRALYDGLGEEIRAEYHLLIGEHLERSTAGQPASAAAIARHFEGAGVKLRAIPYLLSAGRHARDLYAHHEARRHLERAREAVDIWWLEEPEGEARELRFAILKELGQLELGEGHYEEASRFFAGARSLLVPGLDESRLAEMDRLRGEALFYEGELEEAASAFTTALAHCPPEERREQALILRSRARLEAKMNRWDEALSSCRHAFLLTEKHRPEALKIRHTEGLIYMQRGELADARRLLQEVVEEASAADEQVMRTAALANLGTVLWRQGESDEAIRCLEQSLEIRRSLGLLSEYAQILTNLAIIRTKMGQLDEARRLLADAQDLKERIGDAVGMGSTQNSLGNLETRAGRLREALEHFRRAAEFHLKGQSPARAAVALHNLGEVLLDLGRLEEASQSLDQAREIREEMRLLGALASSSRARGRLLAARGEEAPAQEAFALAAEIARGEGLREEGCKIELDRLRFLFGIGRIAEVEGAFKQLCAECSAWPSAEFDFERRLLEARLLISRGDLAEAKMDLLRLLDEHPADREPYRRVQVLLLLSLREWPGLAGEIVGAWREEAARLKAEGSFDWLN